MKTIQAVPVTHEAFRPYGYIANIADPSGEYAMSETLPAFHRDMVLAPMAVERGQRFTAIWCWPPWRTMRPLPSAR